MEDKDLELEKDITENDSYNESKESEKKSEEVNEEKEYTYSDMKTNLSMGRMQGVLVSFSIFLCLVFAFIGVSGYKVISKDAENQSSTFSSKEIDKKLDKIWGLINYYGFKDVKKEDAIEYLYKGLMASIGDKYAAYYTKSEYDAMKTASDGAYSGIGAYVGINDNGETCVSGFLNDSPAEEAGVLKDDVFATVDGEDVTGKDTDYVVSKVRGPEGSKVLIGFKRSGEKDLVNIEIERRSIESVTVGTEVLEDGIGYIYIKQFDVVTRNQFKDAFEKLQKENINGLIVDLRGNPGGDLKVVVDIADMFLPEGVIVYTKTKQGKEQTYSSGSQVSDIKMVVLVDSDSASASEIFAGSMKDYNRAKIVGQTTYGKGVVQAIIALEDGTGIKITESEYYLPNNECIQDVGITPDVLVEFDAEKYEADGIDTQLDKAIEVLKKEMDAE